MLTLKQFIVYFVDRTKGFLEIMDAALVGKRAVVKKFMQNWGPRMYAGNVNAVTFLNFVTDKLCPNLLPFNGRNPRTVVILGKGSL